MEALPAELAAWRRHTTGLSKHAMAIVDNGRAGTDLVSAVQQMRNSFAEAMRQAHAVERLFQAHNTHAAQQAVKSIGRKRRPAEGPSPQQAQWMAELKPPKGGASSRASAAAKVVPKNATALSVGDREDMWELFQDLDSDGSGSLEIDEFARLAESLGRRLSERECKAAMAEMDQDGSGAIEFEEFASWVRARPWFSESVHNLFHLPCPGLDLGAWLATVGQKQEWRGQVGGYGQGSSAGASMGS
jgi:hypothetical protein